VFAGRGDDRVHAGSGKDLVSGSSGTDNVNGSTPAILSRVMQAPTASSAGPVGTNSLASATTTSSFSRLMDLATGSIRLAADPALIRVFANVAELFQRGGLPDRTAGVPRRPLGGSRCCIHLRYPRSCGQQRRARGGERLRENGGRHEFPTWSVKRECSHGKWHG
jgi:hypothetical protein